MKKVVFALCILILCSCSNDELSNKEISTIAHMTSAKRSFVNMAGTYYTPPFWDWESSNFISFNGSDIPVPWASGAPASAIPLEVKNDFLKVDGWELLYNTFPYSQSDPLFILYNKFTGVARIFMWVTNTTYTASSFTWGFGLQTLNCQTAAFNLNRLSPLPYSSKLSNPNVYVFNYTSDNSVPNGINPNHWYYSDLELAYDPNMANLSHDDIELCLQSYLTDKKSVQLSGSISGSIVGTYTAPSSGSSSGVFSDWTKDFDISRPGLINIPTKAATVTWLGDFVKKQINTTFKSTLSSALSTLSSTLLPSNIFLKSLKNGLISTSASSPGKINCKIDAKTTSSGSITTVTAGPNISLLYPGTKQTYKGGLLPNYNQQLGVWYIDNTPTVKYTKSSYKVGSEYQIANTMSLNINSFNVVVNPLVSQLCSQIVIKKQIVFTKDKPDAKVSGNLIDSSEYGRETYLSGNTIISYTYIDARPAPMTDPCKVRVTLELTPMGKTDPIILFKDFEAIRTII